MVTKSNQVLRWSYSEDPLQGGRPFTSSGGTSPRHGTCSCRITSSTDTRTTSEGPGALLLSDVILEGGPAVPGRAGSGAAALIYAGQNPDRVAGLFLLDPATDPRAIPKEILDQMTTGLAGPQSLDFQKQFYATIAGPNEKVRDEVLADCEAVAPDARLGFGKAFAQWNPESTLDAWKGPIFILSGEASDTPSALYRLRPHIPHRIVKGTGHWLQLDAPDIVADAIRKFLDEI